MKNMSSVSSHLLEEMLAEVKREHRPEGTCLVGECIDAQHPVLQGRVLVRWSEGTGSREQWVVTLRGLPVRSGDRLLLMRVQNQGDLVVTGVLDGFAERPVTQLRQAARLELRRDEVIRIAGSDGRDMIEIRQGSDGPAIRLLHDDLEFEAPGTLTLRARELRLEAQRGQVRVDASDDVIVRGEVIRLN